MYFKAQVPTRPAHRVMTVIIDQDNPDPSTWATYADDAVGMTAGSSAWDDFIGHYPCVLENGVELGKLNPNNFAKYEDGTNAPINMVGKDCMIAFPRRGLKMSSDGRYLTISVTDEDNATGFDYSAFSYIGQECSIVYQGAFKGYVELSKLYSCYGKVPTVSTNLPSFRSFAHSRGSGYEQRTYFPLVYLQALYMLKYKGQNAQIAIGRGYVDGNTSRHNTGTTTQNGMDWGESTGHYACKLFGIEDFWGNSFEWVDGIKSNGSRVIYVADGNFNNTGSEYKNTGSFSSGSNISGWFTKINDNITPQMGFLPKPNNNIGDGTKYFCDDAYIANNMFGVFGGAYASGDVAGVFMLYVYYSYSSKASDLGARLSYFKLKT